MSIHNKYIHIKYTRQGFSLVELVVVITILAILGTVSFLSFTQNLIDARNSDRISDMWNIKISLRTSKQRTGSYPTPGNKYSITNSWVIIAYQGWFDQSLAISTLSQIPKDPRVDNQYYAYSTTSSRQQFQIGMIKEDDTGLIAYVDGDYKTVAKNVLPSILTSTWTNIEINTSPGNKTFILQKWTYNLSYDLTGKPKTNTIKTFNEVLTQSNVEVVSSSEYGNCREIYEAGMSIGAWEYQILDSSTNALINTGCIMNPPNY